MKVKKNFLAAAIVATIIIYLLGFLSGYFLQNDTLQKSQAHLATIQNQFIDDRRTLEDIQLQQTFIDTYSGNLSCSFLTSVLNQMQYSFQYFWQKLPPRLEVYDKYSQITPEYEGLKKDYTLLSVRAWLTATNLQLKCGSIQIKPVLYFYSAGCDTCVNESFVLDNVKKEQPEFSAFIVDFSLNEPIVQSLEEAFNVTVVPSFVFKNITYSGFQTEEELKNIINK